MARRSDASGSTPATVALRRSRVTYTAHAYTHEATITDYGAEAAAALGVAPDRVFKTLLADADGVFLVGIVPVSTRLDLKALACVFGVKRARMAEPALAERKTGYVVGGISPIGQKTALTTVLDSTAMSLESIFVSGGRRGLDIELAPADLLAVTGGILAPIAVR